jgi:hypothetical protein
MDPKNCRPLSHFNLYLYQCGLIWADEREIVVGERIDCTLRIYFYAECVGRGVFAAVYSRRYTRRLSLGMTPPQ